MLDAFATLVTDAAEDAAGVRAAPLLRSFFIAGVLCTLAPEVVASSTRKAPLTPALRRA